MSFKKPVVLYWILTAPMITIFFLASIRPFTETEKVVHLYEYLEFPFWLCYPISFLTLAGLLALIFVKNYRIRELCYIGLFFQAIFALSAHIIAKEWNEYHLSAFALVFSGISVVQFQIMRSADKKQQDLEEEENDLPTG